MTYKNITPEHISGIKIKSTSDLHFWRISLFILLVVLFSALFSHKSLNNLNWNRFDVKALREQAIGFNISKLQFEYHDTKRAEVKGKSKDNNNVKIHGYEEKRISYRPLELLSVKPDVKPLSYSRTDKVIVQKK